MNMNQIINMVIRILMRKGINAGLNRGMRAMRNRGGQRAAPQPDQSMSAQERAEFEEFKRQKKLNRSSVPQTKRKSNRTIERM